MITPRRYFHFWLRLLKNITLVVAGISLFGCAMFFTHFMMMGIALRNNDCPSNNPNAVALAAKVELPSSTADLNSRCGRWYGFVGQISFAMEPDELNKFLTSTRIRFPLVSHEKPTFYPGILEDELPNNANRVTEYLYGEYMNKDKHEWQRVLVDTSNNAKYRVYIFFGHA
jgi:hypothetical protein